MTTKTDAEIRATMTGEQILLERKLTCEAIDGAIAFGYQNTNPPPSDDHWLTPYWKIGRQQAELEVRAARSDAAQAPEGWRLVPTKHKGHAGLTHAMMRAFYAAFEANDQRGDFERLNAGYNAMLAAAPVAPAAKVPSDELILRLAGRHSIISRDYFKFGDKRLLEFARALLATTHGDKQS